MLKIFSSIIIKDITNFIIKISNILDIPPHILLSRYLPQINTFKKKKRTFILKKKNKYNFTNKYRCRARCWGGKSSVLYHIKTKQWSYGKQCSHHIYGLNQYCLTHLKQFTKNGIPDHGNYDSSPPHMHYNKYKKKIEYKFCIRNLT
jgi:hypothetical protein